MKINIVVPFMPFKAGGGLRVMFEYANQLVSRGHQVTLYYPAKVAFIKQPFVKALIKYLLYSKRSWAVLKWFPLDTKISVKCVFDINNQSINDGDIIFSTWWSLMFDIKKLSAAKGKVFNLIQDIEDWGGHEEEVKRSYTIANSNNIVIANYLYKYLKSQTGIAPAQIPFAIDHKVYYLQNPISNREPQTIGMMYSIEPRKGSIDGLNALKQVKLRYPLLNAILFSVVDAPPDLPEWIEYYKSPPNLTELYNRSSIFLSPSLQEGCALPPMEAMFCGCAVICTDIDGHKDYAFNGETAILSKVHDAEDMADKISTLLDDNDLRIKIATQGHDFIKNYTWAASTQKLEAFFKEAVSNE